MTRSISEELGIDAVHHPGRLQFYLEDLFEPTGGSIPTGLGDIADAITRSVPWTRFEDLLRYVWDQGSDLKLYLTLFENGEDSPVLSGVPEAAWRTTDPIAIGWASGHHGAPR